MPGTARFPATKVSFEDVVVDERLNVADDPAGMPVALSDAERLNPFCGLTLIVVAAFEPRRSVMVVAVLDSVNVGAVVLAVAVAVGAEVALAVLPLLAVTVTSSVSPTSADWTAYVLAVAPEMAEHAMLEQRLHC